MKLAAIFCGSSHCFRISTADFIGPTEYATVDHVADAEGLFSEINSASDSFIFRLEQCFALYPDFLTNVEIEAKVIAALQKAESYIVHLKEQHRQHLLETTNSQ